MATFSDDFNRADGGLGANWTSRQNSILIINNQFRGASSVVSYSEVATATASFSADHSAQITVAALSSDNDYIGPIVRCSTSGCYAIKADGRNVSACRIVRFSGTTATTLGTVNIVPAANDTLKLTAVGSTITAYKNGVQVDSVTDSTYTTGQPGVYYQRDNTGGTYGDAFVAVDIASGLTITSVNTTNTAFSAQTDSAVVGTGLSASVVCTYAGIACTNESASSSTSLKITFPNFFTNNIKLGRNYEFKVVG